MTCEDARPQRAVYPGLFRIPVSSKIDPPLFIVCALTGFGQVSFFLLISTPGAGLCNSASKDMRYPCSLIVAPFTSSQFEAAKTGVCRTPEYYRLGGHHRNQRNSSAPLLSFQSWGRIGFRMFGARLYPERTVPATAAAIPAPASSTITAVSSISLGPAYRRNDISLRCSH